MVTALTDHPNEGGFVIIIGGNSVKLEATTAAVAAEWKAAIIGVIGALSQTHSVAMSGQEFVVHKRYVNIDHQVGAGAYGMVVAALDSETGRDVAIKKVGGCPRVRREIVQCEPLTH